MATPPIFNNTHMADTIRDLEALHGSGIWTDNHKGWHISLASPDALALHGLEELHKRHLSFNVSRVAQLQRQPSDGPWDQAVLGYCFKTGKRYCMAQLLMYPPLDKRGLEGLVPRKVDAMRRTLSADQERHLVECPVWGCKLPKCPGELDPLHALPPRHPAIAYLKSRKFLDMHALEAHVGAAWCSALRPDFPPHNTHLPFPKLPLERIVFQSWQRGVVFNWQARLPELTLAGHRCAWHPYHHRWIPIQKKGPDGQKLDMPGYEKDRQPPKYLFPIGSQKARTLMGFDAAVAATARDVTGTRYAVLVEGVFDAARLGPPAIAIMGSSLSSAALALLAEQFPRLVYVADNDVPGRVAARNISKKMQEEAPHVRFSTMELPREYKDAGELPPDVARDFHRHLVSHR